jgi:hypothetical protein
LKDTNNFSGDLRKLIKEGPWEVMGIWGYGLQNTNKVSIPLFNLSYQNLRHGCLSTAIINLKKAPGRGIADYFKILDAVRKDSELIKKEISIIQPDVIVSCGTFGFINELYPNALTNPFDPDRRCYRFDNRLWIDYSHPSARCSRDIMYYSLMMFYQKALLLG